MLRQVWLGRDFLRKVKVEAALREMTMRALIETIVSDGLEIDPRIVAASRAEAEKRGWTMGRYVQWALENSLETRQKTA